MNPSVHERVGARGSASLLLFSVGILLLAALAAPTVHRLLGRWSFAALVLPPAAVFTWFVTAAPRVVEGTPVVDVRPWVPGLDVALALRLDGLGLVFALLITGIGSLVVLYAGGYLRGHRHQGRFYGYFLAFMAAMLGIVLADDLILVFLFWELTSVTSYLLIGFDHHREKARKSALRALLVTGIGGLALLGGLVLLGVATGSWTLSEINASPGSVEGSPLYPWVMALVLAGAFTKSAIFPFSFWLPGAMEAPSPVSAYLHSSTMVKAGVYLVARLDPALGETALWTPLLAGFGALTVVTASYQALRSTELKRLLAYSTVGSLGGLVMLIGLDGYGSKAAAAYLLAHALFKATLFLTAGTLAHETHEKDAERLGGLWRRMPITLIAMALAAISMVGVPPLLGFAAKKLWKKSLVDWELGVAMVSATALFGAAMTMVALMVAVRPFFAKPRDTATGGDPDGAGGERFAGASDGGVLLFGPPLVLAVLGLVAGLTPGWFAEPLVSAMSRDSGGPAEAELAIGEHLKLDPLMLVTIGSVAAGLVLYAVRRPLRRALGLGGLLDRFGPERAYDGSLSGVLGLARWQTAVLQSGYLGRYVLIVLASVLTLAGYALLGRESGVLSLAGRSLERVTAADAVLLVLLAVGVGGAIGLRSRLGAVASLGVVGFVVGLIFVVFGAFDVAMTQFATETLIVIILVLVVFRLPRFTSYTDRVRRVVDATASIAFGVLMGGLTLAVSGIEPADRVSDYFRSASYVEAFGRNVVNVILVDFRAIDTFGEIVVLALAAIGVLTLMRLRDGVAPTSWPLQPTHGRRAGDGGADR